MIEYEDDATPLLVLLASPVGAAAVAADIVAMACMLPFLYMEVRAWAAFWVGGQRCGQRDACRAPHTSVYCSCRDVHSAESRAVLMPVTPPTLTRSSAPLRPTASAGLTFGTCWQWARTCCRCA
eukprot:41844-Chlamydomonas_euryale.AAC.2